MKLKKFLFNNESHKARTFYLQMIKWLENPERKKYNDPEKLLSSSGLHAGQTVLEIGCGSGFFTIPASKMLGATGNLFATDIHPIAIETTKNNITEAGITNVIIKEDDAMNSDFEDNMFDLVLLYGVVPAPVISMKKISKEIYRILKPGGIYAIWTMVPFWKPKKALKNAKFKMLPRENKVFRLQKTLLNT